MQNLPQLPNASLILDALLLGGLDEVYLIDASSMRLIYVSENALKNTRYDRDRLYEVGIDHLLGLSQQSLQSHLESHRGHSYFIEIQQNHTPLIGHIEHSQLRAMVLQSNQQEFILIVKNNVKPPSNNTALQAMVAHAPAVVFQFQLDSQGEIEFIYLTEGCQALLGLKAEELVNDSSRFFALMSAKDRNALRKQLKQSVAELTSLNWEGKIWIESWQDNKWLDVRAMPRLLSDGVTQWEGIMTNITRSKLEKNEIERSRRELGELTAHINKIKEQERNVIAREIHDDLGGNLTAIKIGLASMINRMSAGKDFSVEQAKMLESIVDSTFEAVHRISSNLRPNILDLGIVAALDWQAKEFEKQFDLQCTFSANQTEVTLTSDQAITLFRIFQESISNVVKHAHATRVEVNLMAGKHDIVMTVIDNGVGLKPSDMLKTNSFGLRGMRERAAALHGSFKATQSTAGGTLITLKLPVL